MYVKINWRSNKIVTNKNDIIQLFCDEYTIPGTAYGPKCIKIPILASSYQSGNGLESKLSQSGVYLGVLRLSMVKPKADFPRIRTKIYDNFKKFFILGCIFYPTLANGGFHIIYLVTSFIL